MFMLQTNETLNAEEEELRKIIENPESSGLGKQLRDFFATEYSEVNYDFLLAVDNLGKLKANYDDAFVRGVGEKIAKEAFLKQARSMQRFLTDINVSADDRSFGVPEGGFPAAIARDIGKADIKSSDIQSIWDNYKAAGVMTFKLIVSDSFRRFKKTLKPPSPKASPAQRAPTPPKRETVEERKTSQEDVNAFRGELDTLKILKENYDKAFEAGKEAQKAKDNEAAAIAKEVMKSTKDQFLRKANEINTTYINPVGKSRKIDLGKNSVSLAKGIADAIKPAAGEPKVKSITDAFESVRTNLDAAEQAPSPLITTFYDAGKKAEFFIQYERKLKGLQIAFGDEGNEKFNTLDKQLKALKEKLKKGEVKDEDFVQFEEDFKAVRETAQNVFSSRVPGASQRPQPPRAQR